MSWPKKGTRKIVVNREVWLRYNSGRQNDLVTFGRAIITGLTLLLLSSGCSSLVLSEHNKNSGPYPGLRIDAHFIARPSFEDISLAGHSGPPPDKDAKMGEFSPIALIYGLIDLPLSAGFDTLLFCSCPGAEGSRLDL